MNTAMMNVTKRLPSKLRAIGMTLSSQINHDRTKFVLEDRQKGYRGFIYVRHGRDSDSSLKDLYHNYLYEVGADFSLIHKV